MMVALGPVVGPVVGGFVGEHLDFHYVFLLLAIVGAAALLSNAIWLRETRPAGEPRAFIRRSTWRYWATARGWRSCC